MGFVLYYPRRKLADCRSLPAPDSTLAALGIESFHGTAFPKLMTFLRGIGRTDVDGQKALAELLTSLTAETKLLSTPVSAVKSVKMTIEQLPLSEEDLLKKPFYTVEEEPSVPSAEGILGSLPEQLQGNTSLFQISDWITDVCRHFHKFPSRLFETEV